MNSKTLFTFHSPLTTQEVGILKHDDGETFLVIINKTNNAILWYLAQFLPDGTIEFDGGHPFTLTSRRISDDPDDTPPPHSP